MKATQTNTDYRKDLLEIFSTIEELLFSVEDVIGDIEDEAYENDNEYSFDQSLDVIESLVDFRDSVEGEINNVRDRLDELRLFYD